MKTVRIVENIQIWLFIFVMGYAFNLWKGSVYAFKIVIDEHERRNNL